MAETKTALITGASSGIGLATSRLLLAQGYRIIGISRRGQVAEFEADNFSPLALDLARLEQLESEISELIKTETIDFFIHAAGQGHFGSIEQFSVTQIETSMRVNLTSAMVICRSLVPALRRQRKGRIICIGSESALHAGKKGALYCAAKYGLRGFCHSLREDCGSDGIQVSLVNPGMVRSPFFDEQSFEPGPAAENAIETSDVAEIIWQILQSSPDIVIDEINLSPRIKSINLAKKR